MQNIGENGARGADSGNGCGRAVGADQKNQIREGEVSSVGVSEAQGHTPPLCEGVPLWSVWETKRGVSSLLASVVWVVRLCEDGAIEVVSETGQDGRYESEEALSTWRVRVETDGEKEARAQMAEWHRKAARVEAALVATKAEVEGLHRLEVLFARELRLALDGAPVAVEVAPWQSERAWSARWRDGARLIVGPKRASEGEAWWDASVAAGELARGRVPSVSEVEALVVGLAKMGDDWRKEVCPRASETASGHVSKSGETADEPSVDREAAAVYRALSDARDAHAADAWAQLAEDAPGLVAVAEMAAWFTVALEGEAASRCLDSEADRVAVALVLARAWLARSDAAEVREIIGRTGMSEKTTMTWTDAARVFAAARTLSGLGGES